MRLGTEATLKVALQQLGFSGRLNMAFIERVNLIVRLGIAALALRIWATAQQTPAARPSGVVARVLSRMSRPHASLQVALVQPRERGGKLLPQRYRQRTPAMAAGRTIDDGQQNFAKKTIRPVSILLPRASAARKLHSACQMTGFFLTEREEYVPFVSPSSRVPVHMGNRGGEMDLLASRCSSYSVRLWQACSLYRAKQAHFLNRCPKKPAQRRT